MLELPVAIAAVLYARRARTLALRGRPVPGRRQAWFYGGLLVLLVALVSPVHELAEERLFYMHMVQHLLLGDLAALMIVLGLDGRLLRPLLAWRPMQRLRVLAHPLVALPLWAANLFLWHLPALYEGALRSDSLHALEHALFFTTGALMWAAVVQPLPGPRWFGLGARAGYVLAVRTLAAALANVFIWSGRPFYGAYAAGERLSGVDPLTDQQIAGLIMFVEGSVVTVLAFAWLFLRFMSETAPARARARPPRSA